MSLNTLAVKSKENSSLNFDEVLFSESFIWKRAVTSGIPPSARDSHTCSPWKNKLIVIGGEDEHDYYLSDVHLLDTGFNSISSSKCL